MVTKGRALGVVVVVVAVVVAAGCGDDAGDNGGPDRSDESQDQLQATTDAWEWTTRPAIEIAWDGSEVGAELLGGGGDTEPLATAIDTNYDLDRVQTIVEASVDLSLEDFDLREASFVEADGNDGVWVQTPGGSIHGDGSGIVDRFENSYLMSPSGLAAQTRLLAVTSSATSVLMSVYEGNQLRAEIVSGLPNDPVPALEEMSGRIGGVTFTEDGTLIIGGQWVRGPSRIVTVGPDDAVRDLLPTPNSNDGQLIEDPVVFVEATPDGRLAFVTRTENGFELWLLDDGEPRPIGDSQEEAARENVGSLSTTPDGDLLVVADHQIEVIDPDTFGSEVIADLDGADGYLSATAVANDLVFLADGRLWRLVDAFG